MWLRISQIKFRLDLAQNFESSLRYLRVLILSTEIAHIDESGL